eukprot:gene7901-691_t
MASGGAINQLHLLTSPDYCYHCSAVQCIHPQSIVHQQQLHCCSEGAVVVVVDAGNIYFTKQHLYTPAVSRRCRYRVVVVVVGTAMEAVLVVVNVGIIVGVVQSNSHRTIDLRLNLGEKIQIFVRKQSIILTMASLGKSAKRKWQELLGQPQEEDDGILSGMKNEMDGCMGEYCKLSRKQRLYGFAYCFAAGCILGIVGTALIALGNLTAFAICYSLGTIMSLASSLFLWGPWHQFKNMFKETRWLATTIMLASIAMTLVSAIVWKRLQCEVVPHLVSMFSNEKKGAAVIDNLHRPSKVL